MKGEFAPRPTIYFVNQISRHGHLDLYARLYTACALELGYRVVLLAEHESDVQKWVRDHCAQFAEHFQFSSRQSVSAASDDLSFWGRVTGVWRRQGVSGLVRRAFASIGSRGCGLATRLLSRVINIQSTGNAGMSFEPLVDEIIAAERESGWPASLVIFLYLDMMSEDRRGWRDLDKRLKRPWAGILFHPRYRVAEKSARPEAYFDARTARGAAFLNPHVLEAYARRYPDQVFGLVPDVTDAPTASETPRLVSEFTRRASARTIVGLVGSLSVDKGLIEFLKVIERADSDRFFFIIIGEIFWGQFGPDEATLERFAAAPPEHCFVHVGYLDDERHLNSVIAAADILYAVYPNQRDSSNTLTKAAILEKPVLVNDAHLMGERVRDYRLGATVQFADIDGILDALQRLRDEPKASFGFARYREAHSLDALAKSFAALVTRWIQPSGTPALDVGQ